MKFFEPPDWNNPVAGVISPATDEAFGKKYPVGRFTSMVLSCSCFYLFIYFFTIILSYTRRSILKLFSHFYQVQRWYKKKAALHRCHIAQQKTGDASRLEKGLLAWDLTGEFRTDSRIINEPSAILLILHRVIKQ